MTTKEWQKTQKRRKGGAGQICTSVQDGLSKIYFEKVAKSWMPKSIPNLSHCSKDPTTGGHVQVWEFLLASAQRQRL